MGWDHSHRESTGEAGRAALLQDSPHLLLFFKLMSFLTLCCHFKGLEVTVQLDRMSSVWLCFSVSMLIEAQRVAK